MSGFVFFSVDIDFIISSEFKKFYISEKISFVIIILKYLLFHKSAQSNQFYDIDIANIAGNFIA